jgi:hypothetical protein
MKRDELEASGCSNIGESEVVAGISIHGSCRHIVVKHISEYSSLRRREKMLTTWQDLSSTESCSDAHLAESIRKVSPQLVESHLLPLRTYTFPAGPLNIRDSVVCNPISIAREPLHESSSLCMGEDTESSVEKEQASNQIDRAVIYSSAVVDTSLVDDSVVSPSEAQFTAAVQEYAEITRHNLKLFRAEFKGRINPNSVEERDAFIGKYSDQLYASLRLGFAMYHRSKTTGVPALCALFGATRGTVKDRLIEEFLTGSPEDILARPQLGWVSDVLTDLADRCYDSAVSPQRRKERVGRRHSFVLDLVRAIRPLLNRLSALRNLILDCFRAKIKKSVAGDHRY